MPRLSRSQVEKKLRDYWNQSPIVPFPLLKGLEVRGSPSLRGIRHVKLDFRFPVSVLSGRNGSGKSTLLALAALAYHPPPTFQPSHTTTLLRSGKTARHYTFRDFFFRGQSDEDTTGVEIEWRFSNSDLNRRIKKQSNKWMRYETRPQRPVHFLGLGRATHPIEKRHLRQHFKLAAVNREELSEEMRDRFSEIMGRRYRDAASLTSSKASTLRTCVGGGSYTGFNMGSGEDIVLSILHLIQQSPAGTLFVIEELEIALFPQAQRQLVRHLMELALEKKLQFVISSHSETVIDEVPREARILLSSASSAEHEVINGPTTRLAMGNMIGEFQPELIVLCEDPFAATLILEMLPLELRRRIDCVPVGSASELGKACAYMLKSAPRAKFALIWDGDQRLEQRRQALSNEVCRKTFVLSLKERVYFGCLPGSRAPERETVEQLIENGGSVALSNQVGCTEAEALRILEELRALSNHHDIPHRFSVLCGCNGSAGSSQKLCAAFAQASRTLYKDFLEEIRMFLSAESDHGSNWKEHLPWLDQE
jgi:predicted ATPase